MPIQSMTGFGKGEKEGEKFTVSVELKTVNNRFKDIRFKMSNIFNSQELPLKKKIEGKFSRGSFDIYVNYKKVQISKSNAEIDYNKVEAFLVEMKKVSDKTGVELEFSPTEFMKSDFYVEDESKEEELSELLIPAFDDAILALEASRIEEGQKLVKKLEEHANLYTSHFEKVKELKGSYQEKVKDKLKKRFETDASGLSIDEPRFLQEVIYYLEKLDIDEEINRIVIHLEKLAGIFASKTEVGRQIDFLVQELNRETNTIGSKSGNSEISEHVVQMKVQLEKIREQALNLE
jgi:uncharacterized protein (TIGR00255 family)